MGLQDVVESTRRWRVGEAGVPLQDVIVIIVPNSGDPVVSNERILAVQRPAFQTAELGGGCRAVQPGEAGTREEGVAGIIVGVGQVF